MTKTKLNVIEGQPKFLFINEDGSFAMGGYVPAYIRRYPFVLASDEAQQRMVVCIERNATIFVDKKKADLLVLREGR